MPHKNLLLSFFAVILLASVVIGYLFYRSNVKRAEREAAAKVPAGLVRAPFAGVQDTSADAVNLNRVVRGKLVNYDAQDGTVIIATQVNWPQKDRTVELHFSLTAQTQYLCWPKTMSVGNGSVTSVEDASFFLDSHTKLSLQGETYLTKDQAVVKMQDAFPLVIALQRAYSKGSQNTIFQIGIIGCQ